MMISHSEQIKSRLSIREVAERYGVRFDTRGRALCPFHDDRHPSGTIKNERFHCFVCGLHLDIFDFTQQIFNISFQQAVLRLNDDFCLGLTGKKPDRRELIEWERKKAADREELNAYRAEYDRNVLLHRYISNAQRGAAKPTRDTQAIRRAEWAAEMEYLDYYFKSHPWR